MGTRSDYYVGTGKEAEWLGSLAFDGYPHGAPKRILGVTSEPEFRQQVAAMFAEHDDATLPEKGWPWPWNDSRTTDFAYCFDGGRVEVYCFGRHWPDQKEPDEKLPESEFPDMTERKNVTRGRRSGLLMVGTSGSGEPVLISPDAIDRQEAEATSAQRGTLDPTTRHLLHEATTAAEALAALHNFTHARWAETPEGDRRRIARLVRAVGEARELAAYLEL